MPSERRQRSQAIRQTHTFQDSEGTSLSFLVPALRQPEKLLVEQKNSFKETRRALLPLLHLASLHNTRQHNPLFSLDN